MGSCSERIYTRDIPSRTHPNKIHHFEINKKQGTVHCSCESFFYNKYCWVTETYKKITIKILGKKRFYKGETEANKK